MINLQKVKLCVCVFVSTDSRNELKLTICFGINHKTSHESTNTCGISKEQNLICELIFESDEKNTFICNNIPL